MGGWAEDQACADPRARTPIGASWNLYFPWRSRDIAACKSMCSCAAAVVFSFALLSSVTFKIGFYLSFHLHSCRFSRFSALSSVTFSGEIFTCLCFHYVLSHFIPSSVILISFLLCSLSSFSSVSSCAVSHRARLLTKDRQIDAHLRAKYKICEA